MKEVIFSMAKQKYKDLVKTIPFKEYGRGYFRQGTVMDSAFLGLDCHIQYGAFWTAGRIGEEPYVPHTHNFDQIMCFLGSDQNDLSELWGEVEVCLGEDLEKYRITVSPEKIHDLLYFAALYMGEGATMAAEAAILGTPSIYASTIQRLGYINMLRDHYGLVYNYADAQAAIGKAKDLLDKPNTKEEWRKKREALLEDTGDVTKWMVDFIETYPESFSRYRRIKKG